MALIYLLSIVLFWSPRIYSMTKNERAEMRETVKDMFHHAYDSYMTHAYPADELMPLNCKGRYRDTEPSRGDVDDILGNFSMTLIDSLDSLVIFGEVFKFEEAVKLVIDEVVFDSDIVVSTFETNIRVLGGLLGGHVAADVLKNEGLAMDWYDDELLDMAKDIGERLMPAFNTTTGIPYPKVNLKYGVADPRSRTGTESATCTACAGTMIMEFGALSRLTGDPKFEAVAHKAMKALWTYRSRSSDLVGTVINIHNGEWVRRDSGVGAGIDSYYEYCLKAYILLGEEDYLQRFNQHYKAVMRYINRDSFFLNVHMNNPSKRSVAYMDSLQAFWPGLQVLKGDIKSAIELHEVFYSVAKRHTFLPEAFTTNFEVHWGQHFLRPELVESTYFLHEATKDPYYLEVGKYIVGNLNKYTRVPCGFAAVKDVRIMSHENRMDSFLLSETLKYLYLLFTDKEDLLINLHDFVFTTEAHILPLALSNWNGSSSQTNVYESDNLHDHSCPRTARDGSMMSFAEKIRRKSRQSKTDGSCPKTKEKQSFVKSKSSAPLLRAEQFIPGNKDHLLILKAMGISVTKTDDGKVQLMQDANSADNAEMAGEGVTFMQSMIELAKFRSNDAEYLPRVVQILSAPYNGNIVLNAGPAQFGIDLGKTGMGVSAEVILADPFKGCTELNNKVAVDHRIVVMERGECMFIDKVRVAESLGAVGTIIIDNNEGSSSESQPMFAMSGDGSSGNINIPAVFLFHSEGQVLQKSMQIVSINSGENLRVRLADKALKKDANKEGTVTSSRPAQNIEPEVKTESTSHFQEEKHEKGSGKLESLEHDVNKLIEVMKKVVKQPGFEFLTGQSASLKMGDINTADKRERLLYDAMMENWQEKGRAGETQSGGLDEVVVKLKGGLFAIKAKKADGNKMECRSIPEDTKESCKSPKIREEFLKTVARRGDDSEIIVVGSVDDEKLSGEESNSRMDIVEKMVRLDGSLSDPSDDYLHTTETNSRFVEKTIEVPDNTKVPKRKPKMIRAADGDTVVFTDCDPDETPVGVNEGENILQVNIDNTGHSEPENSENNEHVLVPKSVSVDDATDGKTKEIKTLTGEDAAHERTFDQEESTHDTNKVEIESAEGEDSDRHRAGDNVSDEESHVRDTDDEGKQVTEGEKERESDTLAMNTGKDFEVNSVKAGGQEKQGFTQDTFEEVFSPNLDERTRIVEENSKVNHDSAIDLNIENHSDNSESVEINADNKHIAGEPPEE
ncbi:ER degradation-enhancing alpha-mannosidase-like protein 3 [Dendronephthya gigantea]|uniref:ER degradation-enhancing alpha-mannosidase-like protein 3 n=1 Tax=Dendronephthya gigantea TaxID=151771 RepID=UPI001069ED52|nr:ER degradation-enhancing alpha-mannosidase-like protein 3 [Dendronephthya gigantea]